MCGLAAFFQPGKTFSQDLLGGAERDLFHRGPDYGGRLSEPGQALVFRRLSIMDVTEAGNQPMTDSTGRLSLVFNGEIYNYPELKKELESQGAVFQSGSDTEAILLGYLHWGEALLERLEGMYAFVLVDRFEGVALAARDPFGIKPLYMLRNNDLTAFSSEMRVLTRLAPARPDHRALAELLMFGWAAGNLSNLEGIERVPGGTLFRVRLSDGDLKRKHFFNILDLIGDEEPMGAGEAEDRAEKAVHASLKAHLMSDVGYTLQLSGGVDSSLVAALAAKETDWDLSSFGVNLGDHPFDESAYRREVVERYGLQHSEIPLGNKEFADAFEKAVWHMEGPVPHMGCVMIMLICEKISAHSKVVLTGEGADEMFGGYDRYGIWKKLRLQSVLSSILPTGLLPDRSPFMGIKRIAGLNPAVHASLYRDIRPIQSLFTGLDFEAGARHEAAKRGNNFIWKVFAVDQSAYLESLLVRQDKMSMAFSVEARVPYVHLPLARVLNKIPRSIMAPGKVTKPLLKKIAEPHLSHELLYRRKIGLNLPYLDWLRDEKGFGRYLEYLTEPGCRLAAYGNGNKLNKMVDEFRRGATQGLESLPMLVNTEIWLRQSERLQRG